LVDKIQMSDMDERILYFAPSGVSFEWIRETDVIGSTTSGTGAVKIVSCCQHRARATVM